MAKKTPETIRIQNLETLLEQIETAMFLMDIKPTKQTLAVMEIIKKRYGIGQETTLTGRELLDEMKRILQTAEKAE
jgi:hypothetical protein